ncbi:MAG: HD domain-containing protein [Firmicutes bacterium]|nr:HD domain-containing protein [Bacillota bacterium]
MLYKDILGSKEIVDYYEIGTLILGKQGFIDHSPVHTRLVAERAAKILDTLGYRERDVELAQIAGYLHDIGNCINRSSHAEYGAIIASQILKDADMEMMDRVQVVSSIANHEETEETVPDPITAAIIIADKTDVRRTRVRERDEAKFNDNDWVNKAAVSTELKCDASARTISLTIGIDESVLSVSDYIEMFTGRANMCLRAAETLKVTMEVFINDQKVL